MTNAVNEFQPFSTLASELADVLATVASDIVLVLDKDGIIRSVAMNNGEPIANAADSWVGRPWLETVTEETRPKAEALFREVVATGVSKLRHINQLTTVGTDIPIAYTAIRLGDKGPVLASGRDLRTVAALQQRFIETQQEMERDYWKLRQAETRYRLLFEISPDPVMIVSVEKRRIIEANRAAAVLVGLSVDETIGQPATVGLAKCSHAAVEAVLAEVIETGRPSEALAQLNGTTTSIRLAVTFCQSTEGDFFLMRARAGDTLHAPWNRNARLLDLVRQTSDAIVVTDMLGTIQMANDAFLRMVELTDEQQVLQRDISDWLGHPGDNDLQTLYAALVSKESMRFMTTELRGERGKRLEIEYSATIIREGDTRWVGLILRQRQNLQFCADTFELSKREIH